MKCFLTGITGFAGGYLAHHLAGQGARVFGIGLQAAESESPARVAQCDILDFHSLASLLDSFQPDFVYHLAGLVQPAESQLRPREYYLVNVQGTVNLLEAVRCHQPQARVLLVSSSEVYGKPSTGFPFSETAPLLPTNPYASSKVLSEEVGRRYGENYGCRVVTARPFNHSGPGQSEEFVVADFCKQIALIEAGRNAPQVLVGNLSPVKEFLDVRDVVRAYAGLAEKGVAGEVYNVCSGVGVQIGEILELALGRARVEIEVIVSPEKYRQSGHQPGVGNKEKIHALLGWRPQYTLEQTVADTLEYWRGKVGKVPDLP